MTEFVNAKLQTVVHKLDSTLCLRNSPTLAWYEKNDSVPIEWRL